MRKICHSVSQTHKAAEELLRMITKDRPLFDKKAVVVALIGDLGAGKTAFTQGFAKALGIKERITSPTFVLLKKFSVKGGKNLIHIDAYRFENSREMLVLGFKEMLNEPSNIILIEWAEKIKKILPKRHFSVKLGHKGPGKRSIDICFLK